MLLVTVSGIAWSLFDVFRKQLTVTNGPASLVVWLLVAQAVFFLLLLPFETIYLDWGPYWLPGGINIVLNVIADILFLMSVQMAPLSLTVPILSFTPLFTAVSGYFLLGETLTGLQMTGIGFIIWGAILLSRKVGQFNKDLDEKKVLVAMGYMLITALCWAISPVLDKLCLQVASPFFHADVQTVGIVVIVVLYFLLRRQPIRLLSTQKDWWTLGLATLVFGLALFTQYAIIMMMNVGLAEAFKRCVCLICALVFGYTFFKEPIYWRKVLALGLMIGGVVLLSI